MDALPAHRPLRLVLLACLSTAMLLAFAVMSASRPVLAFDTGVTAVIHEGDTESPPAGGLIAGCTLHLHFSGDAVEGAWAIRAGDEHGDNVLDGPYDTTAGEDRVPDSGTLELESGHYVLVWDNERPIDDSFGELAFDVGCEAPVESGSEAPIESGGSEAPIESGGSELPISGSGSPSGVVLGVVGTPAAELPATDTAVNRQPTTDLRPTLGLLALIGAGALAFANRYARRRTSADKADRNR